MLKESRNSHVNLKKRKICTVVFYEDLTICIILKNLYHIKNYIELKFCTSYFLLDSGSIVLLHSDSIVSDLKKRLHYFRGVEFVRQCAFLDGNMCCSIHALSLTFAVYQSQIWLVGFAALNLAIAEDYMACPRSAKRFEYDCTPS